jgi:hypothetical protein
MAAVGQAVSLDCNGARRVVDGLLRVEGGLAVGPYDPVRLAVPDASLGAASGALMSSLRVFEVLASTRSADLGRELASRIGLVLLEDDLRLHLQPDALSREDGGSHRGSPSAQGATSSTSSPPATAPRSQGDAPSRGAQDLAQGAARGTVDERPVAAASGDGTDDARSLEDVVRDLLEDHRDVQRLVEWILRIILESLRRRLPLVPSNPWSEVAPRVPPFTGCRPSRETMQRRRARWSVPS